MRRLSRLKTALLGATAALGFTATVPAMAADKTPIVFVAAVIESGPFKVTDVQNLAGVRYAVEQVSCAGLRVCRRGR